MLEKSSNKYKAEIFKLDLFRSRRRFSKGRFEFFLCSALFCFCLRLHLGVTQLAYCLEGWTLSPSTYTCVRKYDFKKNWNGARRKCVEEEGDLVSIPDFTMNYFLYRRVLNQNQWQRFWIGYNDIKKQGNFQWPRHMENPDIKFWKESLQSLSNEACVVIGFGNSVTRKWLRKSCTSKNGFVCERLPVCFETNAYGTTCSQYCSLACSGVNKTCDRRGFCNFGCVDGYQGKRCDSVCSDGTYGAKCSHNCSAHCGLANRTCDNVNGSCFMGCTSGYKGEKCDVALVPEFTPESSDNKPNVLIVVAALLAIAFLAVIGTAVGNKTGKDKEESAAEYEFESLSGPQSARYDLSKEKDSFEDKNSSVNFDSSVPYVSSEYGSGEESNTSE